MMPPLGPTAANPDTTPEDTASLLQMIAHQVSPADQGHFDELRSENGQLRDLWKDFYAHIGHSGVQSLPEFANTIDRIIRLNGVTYNVYAQNKDHERPWSLNPLPMLITPSEWREISTGLSQRAKLLNLILQDVYTDRSLLKAAYLPSALVVGNPGYLHAMHGVRPLGGIYLHVVAFDLARGPDGRWWVIGQRTQAPSGLGYVLESRLIVSRLFPQAYRDMKVQNIGSSYRKLLEALAKLTEPISNGTPRLAFLTPGASAETYFEHAYLARYLGIPLVEGADLTVRDGKVYMRTIEGLKRIHGLMRRVDDEYCDPLELRPDSSFGVPGLLEAARREQVVIANALGTGFLESPAIQGFLPTICEYLLGEPLKLPSLHTWWCGEEAAWQEISPHLKTQVIKPTFATNPSTNFDPAIAAILGENELRQWRHRIEQQPSIYTTQTYLPFSQVPIWRQGAIEPRTAMLRFYAIVDSQGQWQVMPGGMTRVAAVDPHIVSLQSGGSTLDTWVVTDDEVDTFSMLPSRSGIARRDSEHNLVSSRTAENLYWVGRYTERTETTLRLARQCLELLSRNRRDSQPLEQAISILMLRQGLAHPGTPGITQDARAFADDLIQHLWKPGAGGLYDTVDALEKVMRTVRERLPPEHVEIPARIKQLLNAGQGSEQLELQSRGQYLITAIEQLELLEVPIAALVGYQLDRMTRDFGWRLLAAGRLIERLVHLGGVLKPFFEHGAVYTPRGFDALLNLFDSLITFRSRYQRHQDILALLDLVITDPTNPRSIACILNDLRQQLAALPDIEPILALLPSLDWDGESIKTLLVQIDSVTQAANTISDAIGKRLFAHVPDQLYAT